ncbi:IS66-like element accessory protein TnpA [Rhizobium sp. C4]|uniref:IS66-like element accessory protein TnpA n=1 Tax=Rhizobium sp. C4 TaxID=1349800 RepID=UPI001E36740D|nr:transposase [Rhizobium sp. C4]MCD2175123.1 transposase [Rhizobium sp. C4]
MAKVEILTGGERQRRWSTQQKLSILQEAFGSDAGVSVVARRHDVLPQQIYGWRKKFAPPELAAPQTPSFVPVSVVEHPECHVENGKGSGVRPKSRQVELVLRNGRILKIAADMDLVLLASLIACVEAA